MEKVVITGASRGIGKATAEKFLAEGWKVIGTSTSGEGFEHEGMRWVQLDLANPASIEGAVAGIGAYEKDIAVIINNAGVLCEGSDELNISMEKLRKTLEVNLIGTIDFTERMVPCIAAGGHIINTGSRSAIYNEPFSDIDAPAYRISKGALNMYTRLLAERLKDKGITVSSFDPGWVKTDMGGEGASREPEEPAREVFELATAKVPTGRFWHQGKVRSW